MTSDSSSSEKHSAVDHTNHRDPVDPVSQALDFLRAAGSSTTSSSTAFNLEENKNSDSSAQYSQQASSQYSQQGYTSSYPAHYSQGSYKNFQRPIHSFTQPPLQRSTQRLPRPTRADGRADTSYRDPKKAGDILQGLVKRQGWSKKFSIAHIMNGWEEIVGKNIAFHTTPIKYDPKNMILTIQCDSTAWATQLRFIQADLLKEISRILGPNVVAQVKILSPNIRRHNPGKLRVKGRGPRDDFG